MFDWSAMEWGFGPGVTPSQAVSAPGFYGPAPISIPDPTQPVNVLGPPVVPDPTKPVNVLGPSLEELSRQAQQNTWDIIDRNNRELAAQQAAQAEQARLDQERRMREIEEYINMANEQEAEEDRKFKAELDRLAAEDAARRRLDEESFAKAQAELDALFQQERDEINRQAAEYAAMQKSVQEQAEAARLQAEEQQRMLAEERAKAEAEAAAVAERGRKEMEGMQREGAEREVARRRVARSTVARPLLGGLAQEESGPQKLGYGGAFGGGGRLAGAQTLGVG